MFAVASCLLSLFAVHPTGETPAFAAHSTHESSGWVSTPREGWTASGQGLGFRASLDVTGLTLRSASEATGAVGAARAWSLSLRTVGLRRERSDVASVAVGAGEPAIVARRAALHRDEFEEWFVVRDGGIEQGWTIATLPAGAGALVIDLELSGLSPRLSADGRAARLADAGGTTRLHYRGLQAFDARGHALDAELRGRPGGLAVHVDVAQARFPIVVDPVLSTVAWSFESNVASAQLGNQATTAGDVDGDGFSDLLVGAPGWDTLGTITGRALLFLGSPSGPSPAPDWFFDGENAGDLLGQRVSPAGDVDADGYDDFLVAAIGYNESLTGNEGRVYLFRGGPDGPELQPSWSVDGVEPQTALGNGLGPAGDVNGDGFADVLITGSGEFIAGRAYVYAGSADGLSLQPLWTVAPAPPAEGFGASARGIGDVNGDGFDDIAIGTNLEDTPLLNSGSVRIYHGSPSGPSLVEDLRLDGALASAQFGISLGRAGDVDGDGYADLVVGAWRQSAPENDEGAAFLFPGGPGGMSATPVWSYESDQDGAQVGLGVSAGEFDGDGYPDLIVGAPGYTDGEAGEGRVLVFRGGPSGPSVAPDFAFESNVAGSALGRHLSGAGDCDGDGFGEILAGAPLHDGGEFNEGRVLLFSGEASSLTRTPQATLTPTVMSGPFAAMGQAVDGDGDVNGDGFDDLLVGLSEAEEPGPGDGRIELFLGSVGGLSSSPDWSVDGDSTGGEIGGAVVHAGDVNGDGRGDVLYGSRIAAGQPVRTVLVLGSATGLEAAPAWTLFGTSVDDAIGATTCSPAGDVNGDGLADVLVFDHGPPAVIALYLGSPAGLEASPLRTWAAAMTTRFADLGDIDRDGFDDIAIDGDVYRGGPAGPSGPASQSFGPGRLEGVGDLDGDGYADAILGPSPVSLLLGSGSGLVGSAWFYPYSTLTAVSGAGDVNGDGYGDLAVSDAGAADLPLIFTGRCDVFLGSASGPAALPDLELTGATQGDVLGWSVSLGGDFTGDGFGDLAVGVPQAAGSRVGFVEVFEGGDGSAVPFAPRQVRPDGSPVARGGSSGGANLRLDLSVGRPGGAPGLTVGRTRFGLEVEARSSAAAATGDPQRSVTPPTNDTGASASSFTLSGGDYFIGPYTWRARLVSDDPLFPHTRWFDRPGRVRITCPDVCGRTFCEGQVCPCGNVGGPGGCKNSTGADARLTGSGSTSLAQESVVLDASGLPPGNLALFVVTDARMESGMLLGDGRVCVGGGGSHRYAPFVISPGGTAQLTDLVSAAPPGFVQPSQTLYSQLWYRDVFCSPLPVPCPSPCGTGTNLTNGFQLTFGP